MRNLLAALLGTILLWPLGATAQSVIQSGNVTSGHATQWVAPGIIKDGGTATTGTLNTLGVTSDSSCSMGVKNTTGERLCLGVTGSQAQIGVVGFDSLIMDINGVTYTFPVDFAGSVTSVNVETTLSGLTVTGGPITTSGTMTLSGTLGLTSGGTGATTQTGAATAIMPSQSGNAGLFLRTDGTNVEWAAGAGGVSSVGMSGGTTGMSFSGSPVIDAGVMTMTGTLVVSNGGTGATTFTSAGLLYGNGTSAVGATSAGSSGECLTSNGAGVPPTFQPCVGGGTVTSIATGGGLTGGPITSSGTIEFAAIADNRILANVAGTSTAAVANTLTDILDATLTDTQGSIIYRGASVWEYLTPGTSGQVLTTNGAAANPSWETATSGGAAPTMQVFTSTGTWTKPANLQAIVVWVVGGGGGAASSTAGGTSSFGSHCSATGGGAGSTSTSTGGVGGAGSGGDVNLSGSRGGAGAAGVVGGGAPGPFGSPTQGNDNQTDYAGISYGGGGTTASGSTNSSGGGGGACMKRIATASLSASESVTVGAGGSGTGAGAPGIIVVTEYY